MPCVLVVPASAEFGGAAAGGFLLAGGWKFGVSNACRLADGPSVPRRAVVVPPASPPRRLLPTTAVLQLGGIDSAEHLPGVEPITGLLESGG